MQHVFVLLQNLFSVKRNSIFSGWFPQWLQVRFFPLKGAQFESREDISMAGRPLSGQLHSCQIASLNRNCIASGNGDGGGGGDGPLKWFVPLPGTASI